MPFGVQPEDAHKPVQAIRNATYSRSGEACRRTALRPQKCVTADVRQAIWNDSVCGANRLFLRRIRRLCRICANPEQKMRNGDVSICDTAVFGRQKC